MPRAFDDTIDDHINLELAFTFDYVKPACLYFHRGCYLHQCPVHHFLQAELGNRSRPLGDMTWQSAWKDCLGRGRPV